LLTYSEPAKSTLTPGRLKKVKVLFYATVDFQKRTALFEGFQASGACPSYKSRVEMKVNVWHRWNDKDMGIPKYLGKKPVPLPRLPPKFRTA